MKALLAEKKGLEPLKHFQRLLASQAGHFSHPSIFPWVGFCFTKKNLILSSTMISNIVWVMNLCMWKTK